MYVPVANVETGIPAQLPSANAAKINETRFMTLLP